ncbi:MAG: hypothetical protein ACJ798_17940 [Phenylobacterium sp.]
MQVTPAHSHKHHEPVQPTPPVNAVKPKAHHDSDDHPKKVKPSNPPGVGSNLDIDA